MMNSGLSIFRGLGQPIGMDRSSRGRVLNGGLVRYLIHDHRAPASIFSKQNTISLFDKWGRSIAVVPIKNHS